MWNQACSQSPVGMSSHKALTLKRAALQILPCTVSQLLSAAEVSSNNFAIRDWELNQVSVVGIVRGFAPFVTNNQYSVDDMTGPPLNVKHWVNHEGYELPVTPPGSYMKVIGSLRNFSGQRSLLAMNIRSITDPNEITSHMLEVVQTHIHLFEKAFDVNMNTTTAASLSGSVRHPEGILPNDLSTIQDQVLHEIRKSSVHGDGISLTELRTQLHYLSMRDLRSSLKFLANEGHIFSTIDEDHFKSTNH